MHDDTSNHRPDAPPPSPPRPDALPRAATEPAALAWVDGGTAVRIRWADGHESTYGLAYLRRICPCAVCRDTHAVGPLHARPAPAPKKKLQVLSQAQVDAARAQEAVAHAYPVGRYALGFRWADGHDDGIYTFEYLRQMCPSAQNAARLAAADG